MFEQAFKNIGEVLHKDAGCSSELDYTETSWLLFLKYLDALEHDKATGAVRTGGRGETAFATFRREGVRIFFPGSGFCRK